MSLFICIELSGTANNFFVKVSIEEEILTGDQTCKDYVKNILNYAYSSVIPDNKSNKMKHSIKCSKCNVTIRRGDISQILHIERVRNMQVLQSLGRASDTRGQSGRWAMFYSRECLTLSLSIKRINTWYAD